jgi:hypothetical protein
MEGKLEGAFIPASQWRGMESTAILSSIEVAVRVLSGRRLSEAQRRYALDLAADLIELAKAGL